MAATVTTKRSSTTMEGETGQVIQPDEAVLDIPNNTTVRSKFIRQESANVVQRLCVESKKAAGLPDSTTEPTKSLLPRLELLLRWLETDVEMTPELKKSSQIDRMLKLMFDEPRFQFQIGTKERAKALFEKWESQAWGQGEVDEESSEEDTPVPSGDEGPTGPTKRRKSSAAQPSSRGSVSSDVILPSKLRPPPLSHPIFGLEGIMHGAVMKRTEKRKDWIIDSRFPKKDPKVFGHNGIEPGSWWPMQFIALFNGAHGAKMGGIAGNAQTGAYSIVVSGLYEDLDQDNGDVLHYSGSRSHDNEDPKKPFPSSNATLALKASQRTRQPVRVLRSAAGKSTLAPSKGIRYDGLYRVMALNLKMNRRGGLYEQFRLERLDGQEDLARLARSHPSLRELLDYEKIGDGY